MNSLRFRRWVRYRVRQARIAALSFGVLMPWYLAWDALDSRVNPCPCQIVHPGPCEANR